jgi:hypothetical protein
MYQPYPTGAPMPAMQRPPVVVFLWRRSPTASFKGTGPS